MIKILIDVYRAWKMKKAVTGDIGDDECVACGSRDLETLGERAYRCLACGYEGGSGLVAQQEQQKMAAIEAMSPEERRRSGRADLEEAHTLLLSGIGSLEGAASSSTMDLMGIGSQGYAGAGGEGNAKQVELAGALGLLAEAQRRIQDAEVKLKIVVLDGANEDDVDFIAWTADVSIDGFLTDLKMHGQISRAKTRAQQLSEQVTAALERA